MKEFDYKKEKDFDSGDEVFSQSVRAGRRTYFFDVKATRNDDYYLTITESRKKQSSDGSFTFEKHKIFLYKEDFKKFGEGLDSVIDFIKERKPEFFDSEELSANENGQATCELSTTEADNEKALDIEFESL